MRSRKKGRSWKQNSGSCGPPEGTDKSRRWTVLHITERIVGEGSVVVSVIAGVLRDGTEEVEGFSKLLEGGRVTQKILRIRR